VGRLGPVELGASLKRGNIMTSVIISIFVVGSIFGACIGFLTFAIIKINKKIEDDTTEVEIATAKMAEIELQSHERLS
jgi:hypothetical protein